MANIKKELTQIKTAIYGKDVRGSIHDGIDKINKESEESKQKASEAHDVMESIINDGFDNAALEANFEQKLDDEIGRLQPEWTQFQTDVTSQLNDEANLRKKVDDKVFYGGLGNPRNVKPQLLLIDDDTHSAVWSQLKSVLEQEKVPITLAVITGQIGNEGRLTLSQLKQLHKLGANTASHTVNHVSLRSLTESEQEEEMYNSKKWLRDNGFESDTIVYPYGDADNTTRDIARRYFKAGVDIDRNSSLNNPPINTYMLQRVYLNSVGEMHVQLVKDKIDEAKQNNSLIIVGMHCHYAGFSKDGLIEIIQYAKSQGVDIVGIEEALENYANLIDIPNLRIGADGSPSPYSIIGKYRRQVQIFHSNDTIDKYDFDAVSYRPYTGNQAVASQMPENRAGMLFTYRLASDDYAFQTYAVMQTKTEYRRFWDNVTKTWSAWVRLVPQQLYKDTPINHGTLNAGEVKDFTINSSAYQFNRPGSIIPGVDIPTGIMFNFFVKSPGVGVVRLFNTTVNPVEIGNVTWRTVSFEQ